MDKVIGVRAYGLGVMASLYDGLHEDVPMGQGAWPINQEMWPV